MKSFWMSLVVCACVAGAAFAQQDAGGEQVHEVSQDALLTGQEGHSGGGHEDPVAPVLLAIVLVLFSAKIAGDFFERLGMPAVLGELAVGVILGNFALLSGWHLLDFLHAPVGGVGDPYSAGAVLKMLAGIGVVLLLFEVGLESTIKDMMGVGKSAFNVAVLGVVAPMLLGWGVGLWLIFDAGWQVHSFLGATLCATSVGITARVLKDLRCSQDREAQIILGAAVIDDILGLVVLAVVSGVISQGEFDLAGLLMIISKALLFLFGAVWLGTHIVTKPLFKCASCLRGHGLLVCTSLTICFGFAYLANLLGLAPIVGAFAAGLILERVQYEDLEHKENVELEEAIKPLTALLVPIFFVQMGMMVDLRSFLDPSVWGLAAALTVAAIVGKQVCAFGVTEPDCNRFAVGLGMIPRGEVGLIFAAVGAQLVANGSPVINTSTYSAVVVMVMVTTMVTPPLLKWSLTRQRVPVPQKLPAEN